MKTTTLTQDNSAGPTPMPHDIKVTICHNRLEFLRGEELVKISAETLHKVLDDWLDVVRETRSVSSQTKVL
jgi:hypothetical protein